MSSRGRQEAAGSSGIGCPTLLNTCGRVAATSLEAQLLKASPWYLAESRARARPCPAASLPTYVRAVCHGPSALTSWFDRVVFLLRRGLGQERAHATLPCGRWVLMMSRSQWRSYVQVSLSADNDNLAINSYTHISIACYDTGEKKC
jgi:hypothetical protein